MAKPGENTTYHVVGPPSSVLVMCIRKAHISECHIYFTYSYCTLVIDEAGGGKHETCTSWESKSLDLSDCESVTGSGEKKICNHLATWRVTGMLCLILVLIGGGLVCAASCCQLVTCGCCGNSLTCISNVLFWLEVVLSIVTWSFTM